MGDDDTAYRTSFGHSQKLRDIPSEPMAGEASRRSDGRTWPRAVHAAATCPMDIRTKDKQYDRRPWYYISEFKARMYRVSGIRKHGIE